MRLRPPQRRPNMPFDPTGILPRLGSVGHPRVNGGVVQATADRSAWPPHYERTVRELEKERRVMFDPDRFIAECRSASAASGSSGVLEVVSAAVASPAEILHALGEPRRAGVNVLHQSPELTIFNLIWGPQMCQLPHDHRMWAVIGIYTGREDNIFWRRPAGDPAGRIEAGGAKALSERQAVPLGQDIIHSVINPISR